MTERLRVGNCRAESIRSDWWRFDIKNIRSFLSYTMGMIFNGVAYPEAHSSRESDGAWQSVELRELRVFLRLCEDLHFANAAEGLT